VTCPIPARDGHDFDFVSARVPASQHWIDDLVDGFQNAKFESRHGAISSRSNAINERQALFLIGKIRATLHPDWRIPTRGGWQLYHGAINIQGEQHAETTRWQRASPP
jgi:hypothetical protein